VKGGTLRVLENRVLRRIFGSKREEITGSWRKLYTEKLHYLYSFPDVITLIESEGGGGLILARFVSRIGER
jgi:hypothetical protein